MAAVGYAGRGDPKVLEESRSVMSLPRARLHSRLDPAIPLLLVEGGAGNHKHALLSDWAMTPSAELRVIVEFDPRQLAPAPMADQLSYQLQFSGVQLPADPVPGEAAVSGLIERAVAGLDRPLALVVHRLDEIPAEIAESLVTLAGRLPGFRLLATAVDAYDLVGMAVAAGIGYQVIEDTLLAYTPDEVAELVARAVPGAGDAAVRSVLAATRGNPALVERTIELFAPEVLAATVTSEQAFWGWLPERNGPEPFRDALRMLAQAPRFSPALLHCLFGEHRGDYLLERLRRQVGEFTTSPVPVFTWTPALRRQWRRWYAAQPVEQIDADRVRIAECAERTGDVELALLMLLGCHRLDQAASLAADWLWELTQAPADLLTDALASLAPDTLASRPSLFALFSRLGASRLGHAVDPVLAEAEQSMLESRVGGGTLAQLDRLATVAVVAIGAGEVGVAVRASGRWAGLASSRPAEIAAALSPALTSNALLMAEILFQLDRLDLAGQVAVQFLPHLRRSPAATGGSEDARRTALGSLWAAVSSVLGHSRDDDRAASSSAHDDRPLEVVARGVRRTWEALDRGDLDTAEAVTRAAMARLDESADWPILVAHRTAVLLARGEPDRAADEFAHRVRAEQWRAHQQQPDAPGWWAVLAELMLARELGRADVRGIAGLSDVLRSLPRGAQHRWCAGGREFVELALAPRIPADPAVLTSAEAALANLPPRTRWNLGLLCALTRLRAGDESAATQALVAAGASLKHPSAPLVLVLAGREEIDALTGLLTGSTPRPVRESLALADGYPGRPGGDSSGARLAARELEVLDGVRRGLTNAAIAKDLFVSVNTVKFHRTNLYRKLGANSRSELLAEALRLGL